MSKRDDIREPETVGGRGEEGCQFVFVAWTPTGMRVHAPRARAERWRVPNDAMLQQHVLLPQSVEAVHGAWNALFVGFNQGTEGDMEWRHWWKP